jgi:DnaJ domain
VKPVEVIVDLLDGISVALLGLNFNLGNTLVLGTLFGLGLLFGKLTRRISFGKGILALILGVHLYDLLAHARYPFVGAFVLGFLFKHSYLYLGIFRWARSLGDIVFAMRYRRAFEDIRKQEAELEELERQLRQKTREQFKNQQSDEQRKWREQARARQQQGAGNASAGGGGSDHQHRQERPSGASGSAGSNSKGQYLKMMGLDASKNYSKDELKRAYRRRAKETHPDLGGSESAFREVSGAYEWLTRGV